MAHSTQSFPFIFKTGDFVKASYDYGVVQLGIGDDGEDIYYGIVLGRSDEDFFPYGIFYKIFCTDGYVRFFAEWEIVSPVVEDKEEISEDY